MNLRQRLVMWIFGNELQEATQKTISERDEIWATAVYDTFYREGGHPMAGGTVFEWNPIGLSHGIFLEPDWGMIWKPKLKEPYCCPVRVVSESELQLAVLDVFRPKS